MESETDLHSTIANFSAIATFIVLSSNEGESELWKMLEKLHNIWLHPDGRAWLTYHLKAINYIVVCVILEFQTVLSSRSQIHSSIPPGTKIW
jgi:hypothetical protein